MNDLLIPQIEKASTIEEVMDVYMTTPVNNSTPTKNEAEYLAEKKLNDLLIPQIEKASTIEEVLEIVRCYIEEYNEPLYLAIKKAYELI